ncbi:SBBP repeat-containing protein [Gemmatimonas aurantiaca]|nr:SBBP repeat-containing protein [Gemmatimonas aurantiaca]
MRTYFKTVLTTLIAIVISTLPISTEVATNTELTFSSFIGGDMVDWVLDISSDDSGDIYLAGITSSRDFSISDPDSCIGTPCRVAYLAKINGATFALEYVTKFGGTSNEYLISIALDDSGYIYLAGFTESTDFPTLNGLQMNYGGGATDGYLLKLAPDGTTIIWSSYFGGSAEDRIYGITVDPVTGILYLCGETKSSDFPLTTPFDSVFAGESEAFVVSVSTDGTQVRYSSFFGGNGTDEARSIVFKAGAGAVICGTTTSADLETEFTFGATDRSTADGIVATISEADFAPVHTARIGGTGEDLFLSVAIDSFGRICVGGSSDSDDMPTVNAFQSFHAGNGDAYLALISQEYDSLIYAGYFGGSEFENIYELALDNDGYVYFTGAEHSPDIPLLYPYQGYKIGTSDAVAVKLNLFAPTLSYSTYCGGWHYQGSNTAHLRSNGLFCVGGTTKSFDYPQVDAFQPILAGGTFDGFISCFTAPTPGGEICCRTPGDSDHNGLVSIGDVTFVIAYVFSSGLSPVCSDEADANGSGAITIADVTYLISRIFSGGAAPICGQNGIAYQME